MRLWDLALDIIAPLFPGEPLVSVLVILLVLLAVLVLLTVFSSRRK